MDQVQTSDKVDRQVFYQYCNSSNTDLLQQRPSRSEVNSGAGYKTGSKQLPTTQQSIGSNAFSQSGQKMVHFKEFKNKMELGQDEAGRKEFTKFNLKGKKKKLLILENEEPTAQDQTNLRETLSKSA